MKHNMILVASQLVELEHTLAFHQPILQAIEAHNPELAFQRMTAHLQDASALLLRKDTGAVPVSTRRTLRKKSVKKARKTAVR